MASSGSLLFSGGGVAGLLVECLFGRPRPVCTWRYCTGRPKPPMWRLESILPVIAGRVSVFAQARRRHGRRRRSRQALDPEIVVSSGSLQCACEGQAGHGLMYPRFQLGLEWADFALAGCARRSGLQWLAQGLHHCFVFNLVAFQPRWI